MEYGTFYAQISFSHKNILLAILSSGAASYRIHNAKLRNDIRLEIHCQFSLHSFPLARKDLEPKVLLYMRNMGSQFSRPLCINRHDNFRVSFARAEENSDDR